MRLRQTGYSLAFLFALFSLVAPVCAQTFQNPAAGTSMTASTATAAQPTLNPLQNPAAQPAAGATATVPATTGSTEARCFDDILGYRIANVTKDLKEIPRDHDQIWREYDITPYTKGRTFAAGTRPEQTIIDWIIRQTGAKTWHSDIFSTLSADSEKLYVYHTKEVQLIVADIVDRFLTQQFVNDSCKIRAVSMSRPDWIARNHQYLRPIPIVSPGIQAWILEREGAQLLLQDLSRRSDFKEIAQPQFLIPNGVAHNVSAKKQRTYLRDIQLNTAALNGYAEDRVTIDEGFGISFIPLALLDGQGIDATIQLDIVQIEKMIPMMIDAPTATNPRQRVQIESPQVACFKMDEQIRWPKNQVLLIDLGTIPMPENAAQTENVTIFSKLAKDMGSVRRANILLFIENTTGAAPISVPTLVQPTGVQTPQPAASTVSGNTGYWQGIRQ